MHLGATVRNHGDYVNICTKGHVWLLLLPLKCAGFTVCELRSGWCVQEQVGCHFDARAGASREDKKGQRKKYLMEVGSTCQGFRSADEVQLVRVFDNLAETNAGALSHFKNYMLQLDQTPCILLSLKSCASFILLKLSKICYPAGLEAWCLTLCSQICCHELSGLPPSFLLNLIVQKAVTVGSNVLPHKSVFFSFTVVSTLQPGETVHF